MRSLRKVVQRDMERARPPSQPPRDTAMDAARGTVRDALGSLGNLALLSGSVKVGSKAIAGVLPDVLASCSEGIKNAADGCPSEAITIETV